MTAKKKVVILGGGVGGMSAAHELVERGFEVHVYEKGDVPGGKARSFHHPQVQPGKKGFPGEHGFRFFPGFYRHLPDTMARIQPRPATLDLVGTTECEIARVGKGDILLPISFPLSPIDLYSNLKTLFTTDWGLPPQDAAYFSGKLLLLLSSCEARRYDEYEHDSWWNFSEAQTRSAEYQKYCAEGLSRTLVACRARKISARTAGYILLQLMFDLATPGAQVDRVLNGPTNDVWIDPWLAHLRSKGVRYQIKTKVVAFKWDAAQRRIAKVVVEDSQGQTEVTGDYYVSALPGEAMRDLLTPDMTAAEPSLNGLKTLDFGWMVGMQLYLRKTMQHAIGHTMYVDSKWALTSIAQQQFWSKTKVPDYGNGQAKDILSVCISEWDEKGSNNAIPKNCSRGAIEAEVLQQLKDHLNTATKVRLADADVEECHLDPAIKFDAAPPYYVRANEEQLLLNTTGSWLKRPQAVLAGIDNLFLAADYVRTHTDLATMEAANEAARRAVNGIMDAAGMTGNHCDVWPLKEPLVFAPLRAVDWVRFKLGQSPGKGTLLVARIATLPWQVTHTLARLFNRVRFALGALGRTGRVTPRS